ncbi:unnamed protein product [Symbiodinium natans]|uniref:Uncharacterized protein n=1 Tax=Symbiodinium natans TaxID=878477 RepID=A0A812QU99_9DINO|nr:unnamed protein product [Symbiodinium natans]
MAVPLGFSPGASDFHQAARLVKLGSSAPLRADIVGTQSSYRPDASQGAKWLVASGHRPLGPAVLAINAAAAALAMRSRRRPLRSLRNKDALSSQEGGEKAALLWSSICLVAVYITCDVGVNLCSEAATQRYQKASAVLVTSFVSAIIGAVWALRRDGRRGLYQCVALENVFYRANIFASVLFACSSISLLKAFEKQSAAFIKLVGQLKLPLAAYLARYVLGRRYSTALKLNIWTISCACGAIVALRTDLDLWGVLKKLKYILFMVISNVGANLAAESSLKRPNALPFHVTMTNMRIGEIICTLMFLFVYNVVQGLQNESCFSWNIFSGWDNTTFLVVYTHVLDTWITALMVKRLSSVHKYVVKCFTMVLLFGITWYRGKRHWTMAEGLVAAMIVLLTLQFAALSHEESSTQRKLRHEPESSIRASQKKFALRCC